MNKKIVKEIVEGFKGEYFNEYDSFYDYLTYGGWEKDYFASWLESCSDYPTLSEIIDFCKETDRMIRLYIDAVEEETEIDE
jgi:hypothetical protein